jgi:hypothetical protein
MKAKHLVLAIAALLAAGGLWFAWRTHTAHKSSVGADMKTPRRMSEKPKVVMDGRADQERRDLNQGSEAGTARYDERGGPKPGQMLRPPVPNRRFTDFTPEQRVQFARQGHGPGG